MTDFLEEFNRDTGYNSLCATGYPNTAWSGVWASATSNNHYASNFYWGVEDTTQTAAFVQLDAVNGACDPLSGYVASISRTDMYYGDDDGTIFPITPWSEAVHPGFRVRLKLTDNGSDGLFARAGFIDNTFYLGGGGQGRYLLIDFENQAGACALTVSGDNDGGVLLLPDPTLDAWYTLEALWTDTGLEFRLWLDESESRPSTPSLAVGPASPAPAVAYDASFGPEIEWKCQVLPGSVITGNERAKIALDFIRIVDNDGPNGVAGGFGGGSTIGNGGGDSHPIDGSDGTGTDQNPNGFLSHMRFFEGFA